MFSQKLNISHIREYNANMDFPIVFVKTKNIDLALKISWRFSDFLVKMKLLGQIL